MSETANFKVGRAVSGMESSPALDGISAVTVYTDEDTEGIKVGSNSGRNIDVTSPWITEDIGRDILARLRGFQYQPYTARDAMLDPSAEIGDAITLDKVYSGIYAADINFNSLMRTTTYAPTDEDINEEVPFKSSESRRVRRKFKETASQLLILADRIMAEVTARQSDTETLSAAITAQADLIEAKVSRTGGDNASFAWSLTADGWTLTSNGSTVLKANKDGLEVSGKIGATSGTIGGFTIQDGYLSTNSQTWDGTNSSGIYIGSSGIQLGKVFKVDSNGNLTASSGTFSGTIYAGSISYGKTGGYFNGAGLKENSVSGNEIATNAIVNRHITSGSIAPSTCDKTINDYFADIIYANKVFAGNATIDKLVTNILSAEKGINMAGKSFYLYNGYVRY